MQQKLKLRHEYKFLLNPVHYLQLREILKKILKVDAYSKNNQGYHIRSLYFDDAYDTAKKEKELGHSTRKKYRIRIYNCSSEVINMEIKEKFQDYIQKKSFSILKSEFDKILKGDIAFLHQQNDEIKENYYVQFRNNRLMPKVIVDYNREAFVLPFNQIRVTFDTNLSVARPHKDIFGTNISSTQVDHEYAIILEVKYNNFFPAHLRNILEAYCTRPLAISKYVICRDYLWKYRGE